MQVILSKRARKGLESCKDSKLQQRILEALRSLRDPNQKQPNTKSLEGIPKGFRRRVGRYRILYTIEKRKDVTNVWIIKIEKDTNKDYKDWSQYILEKM